MAHDEWWRGAVIYQIYPRSFRDSNGDGIGDLRGITSKLDHVARLGVDAIWLCPFFVSPMRDFGYDVADHVEIDPIFGTMADFDHLLEHAHALGLRVLIDQVFSHTSNEHAWFIESRASRDNPKSDWYVWADPSPDGTPPNNWLSVFGGSAWTWEPRRRQFYLHHFLSHQPALNLHTEAAVEAILDIAAFWLRRGVDGFRLDALDFMLHDPELTPNPPAPREAGEMPVKLFGMQQHRHDMMQPGAMEVLARIRALMDQFPGTATLGEVSSQDGAIARIHAYTAGTSHLHMAYTLRPLRSGFDWESVRALVRAAASDGDGWPCWSFSNHDVERAISRWHPRGREGTHDVAFGRLLMALLLSLRGSVCLYQGEELGLPEAALEFDQLRDPFGIAFWPEFRGRDGSRTPMPWVENDPHGGFTDGEAPWLPVPETHRRLAVDVQEREGGLIHEARRFLCWRRTQPALRTGDMRMLDLPEPLIGIVRSDRSTHIVAILNVADSVVELDASWLSPLPESGFEVGTILPPFGVMFATPEAASLSVAV